MKTVWDYTELAQGYLKRPDYADEAVDEILTTANASYGSNVCDVGAGVAHLTLMLALRGLKVTAVEPNDAMRALGQRRTSDCQNVVWFEGVGENTEQPDHTFDLLTFGSSFNVTNRQQALKEAARILKPKGWIATLWNHRDLTDPIQSGIEQIIKSNLPGYDYGTRREDQSNVIAASGLFGPIQRKEYPVFHYQNVDDTIEAWRSHATLHRQAEGRFPIIIDQIEQFLRSQTVDGITVPYTTRVWMAQLKP